MKIKRFHKCNAMIIEVKEDVQVFISYSTPVAAFIPGLGFLQTEHKFSTSTTQQVNRWFRDNGRDPKEVPKRPQDLFDNLLTVNIDMAAKAKFHHANGEHYSEQRHQWEKKVDTRTQLN